MSSRKLQALFVLAVAGITACGSTEPTVRLAGVYRQTTFEGSPMPYGDPTGQQVISRTLTLTAVGTYTEQVVSRNNIDRTDATYAGSGTFSRLGDSTVLTSSVGAAADWFGRAGGDSLTLQVSNSLSTAVYVFKTPSR